MTEGDSEWVLRKWRPRHFPSGIATACREGTFKRYLHHQHDGVERDHRHDCVLKRWRHHKLPHFVLKAQLVLRHVPRQGPCVDGEVYTGSLQRHTHKVRRLTPLRFPPGNPLSAAVVLPSDSWSSPRSFLNCSPPSSCLLAPGRWWWWEPRRCWRRRKGRRQSTPRKRWTSPSCSLGSDPGSRRSHRLNASAPWRQRGRGGEKAEGQKRFVREVRLRLKVNLLRPPLSSGNSEEGEKGPSHVVVVKIALPPLSFLRLYFVIAFVD